MGNRLTFPATCGVAFRLTLPDGNHRHINGVLVGQRVIITSKTPLLDGAKVSIVMPQDEDPSHFIEVPLASDDYTVKLVYKETFHDHTMVAIILKNPITLYSEAYEPAPTKDGTVKGGDTLQVLKLNILTKDDGNTVTGIEQDYVDVTLLRVYPGDNLVSTTNPFGKQYPYHDLGTGLIALGNFLGLIVNFKEELMRFSYRTDAQTESIGEIIRANLANGVYTRSDGLKKFYKDDRLVRNSTVDTDNGKKDTDDHGVVDDEEGEEIDSIELPEPEHLLENPDPSVKYATREDDLETLTEFNLPNKKLALPDIYDPSKNASVAGTYTKKELSYSENVAYDAIPPKEPESLYDQLVKKMKFIEYTDKPVTKEVLEDLNNKLMSWDIRYGMMTQQIKTQHELLQFLVDFRWRRFNLLDHYIPFTDYANFTTELLSHVELPTDFPVLITGNTILHKNSKFNKDVPFSVDDTSHAIVYTTNLGNATMNAELGVAYSHSLNTLNMSCYWYDADWLITNQVDKLNFLSVNDVLKQFSFKYNIMCVTGVRYVKDHMIVYIITQYVEHALVFDKDFNLVEDSVSEIFPASIIKLMDPKNVIFRDKYQYYVNNDDGTFATFPLQDMIDMNNKIVKKYEILQTTLKDPRPVAITDEGPRINTKYGPKYQLLYSYNSSVSLMTLYPAMGYTFDKYSFYNPRKYLTNADYDEACIPLHKGFRRTKIYPWFWGRPGFTWVDGYYYGHGDYYGRYFSFWNMYWWFYW